MDLFKGKEFRESRLAPGHLIPVHDYFKNYAEPVPLPPGPPIPFFVPWPHGLLYRNHVPHPLSIPIPRYPHRWAYRTRILHLCAGSYPPFPRAVPIPYRLHRWPPPPYRLRRPRNVEHTLPEHLPPMREVFPLRIPRSPRAVPAQPQGLQVTTARGAMPGSLTFDDRWTQPACMEHPLSLLVASLEHPWDLLLRAAPLVPAQPQGLQVTTATGTMPDEDHALLRRKSVSAAFSFPPTR